MTTLVTMAGLLAGNLGICGLLLLARLLPARALVGWCLRCAAMDSFLGVLGAAVGLGASWVAGAQGSALVMAALWWLLRRRRRDRAMPGPA